MRLQEKIQQRQNEEHMLKCQFAARWFFNKAEYSYVAAFVLSILSSLCIFIPDSNGITHILSLILPIGMSISAWACCFYANHCVQSAAFLRNYFDETVLGIKISDYSASANRRIQALINKASHHRESACDIQISNTSRDTPPGVKDWYELFNGYSDTDVVFECQKQNQWWSKKLFNMRMILYSLILLLGIGLMIMVHYVLSAEIIRVCVCIVGLVGTCIERIIEHYKYYQLSTKIDGAIMILEQSKNKRQIIELQKMINNRREIPVLEINFFHRKNSKALSEEYEKISGNN